jgi:phosphate uptake regulator
MFKNLLQFWKGKDFLNQVLEDFKNMLDDTEEMFRSVCRKLIDNVEEEGLEEKIYRLDKKVNTLEKDIRKRIIGHLSVQPSVDISTCLVLMSVVKDAERLGDYAKNLLEVIKLLEKPINKERYTSVFNHLEKEIAELFKRTKEAFLFSDEKKAESSWDYERQITKKCDRIIEELAKSNFSVNEAVCFTLTARYFKRLAAHLTNIATSVIVPISDLDYFEGKRSKDS